MMGVWLALGALLFVMLTGAGYSYPVQRGSDPDTTSTSGYFKNPASDSHWEVPSAVFAPVSSGSWVAPNSDLPQTSAESGLTGGSYIYSNYAVPTYSGYSSGSHTDWGQPSFQLDLDKDFSWAVAPPSPPFDATPPPSTPMYDSVEPELLSYSFVRPPAPPPPAFQGGELSRMEKAYEHGISESETETQGFKSHYPAVGGFYDDLFINDPLPLDLDGPWSGLPYLDYMFLTSQYPPGTVTHYSTSFELGREHTHDTHYMKDYPASSTDQLVGVFPDDTTQLSRSV